MGARFRRADSPNVELRACTIETLAAERAGEFDTVLVADVLYLLAAAAWQPFLAAAHARCSVGAAGSC